MQWFAVMTKPRAEQIGREHLERQGFECRLPRVRHERLGRSGLRSIVEPLFPRYLFLRADPQCQDLSRVRSTRGVCGLVRFGARIANVPMAVIAAIEARSDGSGVMALEAPALRRGDRVRITEGPLSGVDALFEACSSGDRVRLLVRLLGERCQVQVPLRHLAATF